MGTTAALLFTAMAVAIGQPKQDRLLTASDAILSARDDLFKVPPGLRQNIRYLSLHILTPRERNYYRPAIWGHCNKLSRKSRIEKPGIAGREFELLRIDLTHYGWTPEIWDRLYDPYFTQPGGQERYEYQEYGHYRGGRWIRTRVEKVLVRGSGFQAGEWLTRDPAVASALKQLQDWTYAYSPVVDARWFVNQTAASEDRAAGYYDWLGVTDQSSFDKLVGVNEKISRAFRFELREATGSSGVATHLVRVIIRDDSLGGGRWKTLDFDNAKDAQAALNILGRDVDKVRWKATEQFGFLPNELWAVGAFDDKGKIAKTVPGSVANDNASRSNDKRIHNGVSCFRCHMNGGLQDVTEWARGTLSSTIKLNPIDYEKSIEYREQYLRDLTRFIEQDRARYERAIREATGLDSKEDTKRYSEFWELYEDARVTTAHAARDLGLETEEFRGRLLKYIQSQKDEYDPYSQFSLVAAALVHKDTESRTMKIRGVDVKVGGLRAQSVPIHQYEEVIPQLYQATKTGGTP